MNILKQKLNTYLLILVVFLPIFYANGQYDFEWARTYGGDGEDKANSMVELANGDLLICGYQKRQEKHIWIIKVKPNGKTHFGKTYKTMPRSEANDLAIYKDSSIVLVGYCSEQDAFTSDLWMLRIDKNAEKLWDKTYGKDEDENAESVVITNDRCIVVAGMTKSTEFNDEDAWVIKVDEEGELIWEKQFGGVEMDYAHDIIETFDNELIMCGETQSLGEEKSSLWVVKLSNEDGSEIWNKTFDIEKWNYGHSIMQASDSSAIYVAGYTRKKSLIDRNVVLIKLDNDGELIWQKSLDWGAWDEANSIHETYDNCIVVAGLTSKGNGQSSDFAVSKFDTDGNVLWTNIFERKSYDNANVVVETRDNSLVLAGASREEGKNWHLAVLKYRNNDLSAIKFQQDSVSSSLNELYNFKFCISSKQNLKNIQLYFNGKLYKNQIKRPETTNSNSDCDIPLQFELNLLKGENQIEVVITDFKNHQMKRKCKIYFAPNIYESW